MQSRILLVDLEPNFRRSLAIGLRGEGFEVFEVGSYLEAELLIQREFFDTVIIDIEPVLKDWQGILEYLSLRHPEAEIVFTSAFDYSELYPHLLEWGSRPFFVKPFASREIVRWLIEHKAEEKVVN